MVVGLRGHFRQDRPAQMSSACIAIAVKLASIRITPEVLFCYAVDYRKDAMCSCDTSGIAKLGSNMIISDIETLKRWQRLNLPGIHSDAGGARMRARRNSKEAGRAREAGEAGRDPVTVAELDAVRFAHGPQARELRGRHREHHALLRLGDPHLGGAQAVVLHRRAVEVHRGGQPLYPYLFGVE